MKKYLLFSFILLISACNTLDSENDTDAVYIRIANSSPIDFHSVFLSFPNDEYTFGTLESGRSSHYQKFEEAYRYGYIEVRTQRETYVLQPIDYVGETPLRSGKYTFRLGLSEQYVTLETTVD